MYEHHTYARCAGLYSGGCRVSHRNYMLATVMKITCFYMQLRLQLRAATNDSTNTCPIVFHTHALLAKAGTLPQCKDCSGVVVSHPSSHWCRQTLSRPLSANAMASASTSAAGAAGGRLPEHIQIQHDNVICGPDLNYHVGQTLSETIASLQQYLTSLSSAD